jgi:hypothetical protein
MHEISKQDIIDAFTQKKKGKLNLVYLHFKDRFFHKGLSAEVIARKISQELGLEINQTHIYDIHRRYIAKEKQDLQITQQLKQEITQDILHSLQQGTIITSSTTSSLLQQEGNSSQVNNSDNQLFLIDPKLNMDQFEIFLRDSNLSIDQLHKALEQETDIAKQIFIKQKIKQIEFMDNYHNSPPKKSIFD